MNNRSMKVVVEDKLAANLSLVLQLCRFGLVGIIAASVQFSIVVLLVQLGWLTPLIANIFGFLISFQVSYWGHREFTFHASETLHSIAVSKLLLVQLVNLAVNEVLFFAFLACDFPYPIALLIVLTILPLYTFIISKVWIFH